MRAAEIPKHFVSKSPWVDPEATVDRVVIGDPESEHARCLVCWTPGMAALREASARDVRLVVCHEPAFYEHWDREPDATPDGKRKREFIEADGLTVVRIHDSWDRWPELGIPWAWARFLGLGESPAATGARSALHRYDVAPSKLGEFARALADRTAVIGQPLVEVVGDADETVSKIGIGTGCICDIWTFLEMGCDCCVLTDDGSAYWKQVQYARDAGVPVICVNHATAEEPGMVTLARYINENLEGLEAEHLSQGCRYRVVGGTPPD
ncbi:MAG: Nif3-like dinuclear metal center hexameric protein [Planctomycetota bacterium]